MTSKRLYFALIALVALLAIGGIAGVFYSNSFLQKETAEISALKVESRALEEQQRSLIQAKKDIANNADLEQVVKTIVPQEKDQARTVREIIKIASESGVQIATISFPASNLGQITKPTPNTGGTSPTTTPAAPSTPAPKTTQVKPVEGIPGVYQMEINVQSATGSPIPYANLLNFLSRLEQNRRTSHVTNLTVTPSTENRNLVTFSLIINGYIKP